MAPFRALYLIAAGVGCACGVSLDEQRRNSFKVDAQMLRVPRYQYPQRVRQLMKYGIPKRDSILHYEDFQVSFDKRNRVPNYVLERLCYNKLKANPPAKGAQFHADDETGLEVPDMFQAKSYDYVGSGYWKGRLAAGNNHKHSPQSHKDSYTLTTVAPQVSGFALSAWVDLESYVRYLTHRYKMVYVFTGSLYLPKSACEMKYQVIGENQVSVPTHFYKLVICDKHEGGVDMGCYVMANDKSTNAKTDPLSKFRVTLPELEEMGRFRLFKHWKAHKHFGELSDIRDFRQKVDEYMGDVGLAHVL